MVEKGETNSSSPLSCSRYHFWPHKDNVPHPASLICFTAGFLGNRSPDCVISSSSSHKEAIQEMFHVLMDYRKKQNIN